jgi:archaellum biogenesis ATPase FlaH
MATIWESRDKSKLWKKKRELKMLTKNEWKKNVHSFLILNYQNKNIKKYKAEALLKQLLNPSMNKQIELVLVQSISMELLRKSRLKLMK